MLPTVLLTLYFLSFYFDKRAYAFTLKTSFVIPTRLPWCRVKSWHYSVGVRTTTIRPSSAIWKASVSTALSTTISTGSVPRRAKNPSSSSRRDRSRKCCQKLPLKRTTLLLIAHHCFKLTKKINEAYNWCNLQGLFINVRSFLFFRSIL